MQISVTPDIHAVQFFHSDYWLQATRIIVSAALRVSFTILF
jgi:hypothetical protein